jgi:hypothetical protein
MVANIVTDLIGRLLIQTYADITGKYAELRLTVILRLYLSPRWGTLGTIKDSQ